MKQQTRYTIDIEALAGQTDQLEIVLDLVAATQTPGWSQEGACRPCYDWDSGRREKKPNPPRAQEPTSGCAGCTWSFLDGVELLRDEERLLRLKQLRDTWVKQLRAWREQGLAKRWCLEKKRWIEDEANSSVLRWKAKKREISAAERLIRGLEKRLTAGFTTSSGRRGVTKFATFVQNKPTVMVPDVDNQTHGRKPAKKRHAEDRLALWRRLHEEE